MLHDIKLHLLLSFDSNTLLAITYWLYIFPFSDLDYCLDGSGSESLDSPDPFTTPATPDPENSYQCLKWSPYKPDEWCDMYDDASQNLWVLLGLL